MARTNYSEPASYFPKSVRKELGLGEFAGGAKKAASGKKAASTKAAAGKKSASKKK